MLQARMDMYKNFSAVTVVCGIGKDVKPQIIKVVDSLVWNSLRSEKNYGEQT